MKTIASVEFGQTEEVLARLKKQAIPAEIRTVTQESGLEMSEIIVEDSYFDRGCDVVEAWDRTWDETIGYIYKCKDCGDDFVT